MQTIAPFLLSLVLTGPIAQSQSGVIKIEKCEVAAIRDVRIPARQPGVLDEILVEEGNMVEAKQPVAQIDAEDAKLRTIAAQREYDAAAAQAKEPVDVWAAQKAELVAKAEVIESEAVNKRQPGAIPPTELRRQQLTAERATLQIQVAEMEFDVAGRTAEAKKAMVDVGQYDVQSRKLLAPFDGLIAERYRQAGEWVQAGEPVLRLVQMDRLRVQGGISSSQFEPHEIEGQPVEIFIHLPGGQDHQVKSVIGYVSQVVEIQDEYRIWADVENVPVLKRENRTFWLMRPGMQATMMIHMNKNVSTLP